MCPPGSQNPDALAEQMTAAEENKHRLFNFVSELNAELETFESQISLLQQELRATCESTAAKQAKSHLIQQVDLISWIPQTRGLLLYEYMFLVLEAWE